MHVLKELSQFQLCDGACVPLFRRTVLPMCMWARHALRDPKFLKEGIKIAILTTPIELNMNNFFFEKILNMCLKLKKKIEHIRFALKKIKPSKATISINKTDIIIRATGRSLGRTPHIAKHKLKRSFHYTTQIKKRNLMTLALLTGITHCVIFITRHIRQILTVEDVTDCGSSWMTKVGVPL